jgi:putative endonuclease
MHVVYVLQSLLDHSLYVGYTHDMKERFRTHNAGEVRSTRRMRLWTLIYCECFIEKFDAIRRERYLKTTPGKRGLKLILRETLIS